jgi:hypothetical protein
MHPNFVTYPSLLEFKGEGAPFITSLIGKGHFQKIRNHFIDCGYIPEFDFKVFDNTFFLRIDEIGMEGLKVEAALSYGELIKVSCPEEIDESRSYATHFALFTLWTLFGELGSTLPGWMKEELEIERIEIKETIRATTSWSNSTWQSQYSGYKENRKF